MNFSNVNASIFERISSAHKATVANITWYSKIIYYYTPKYELLRNLIGSLLPYYDFILHGFTFYGTFNLLILHDLPFLVDSIDSSAVCSWPTAVLQVDAAQLTILAVCCSFHKQWPKQC